MLENPQFWVSLGAFVIGLAVAIFMYWLEKRPRTSLQPRLFPTTLFLLIGAVVAIVAGLHLLVMFGFQIPQR